jgi:hypothetical protein
MDHLKIEIGYEMLENFIKKFGGFSDVRLEGSSDSLKITLVSKIMGFMKIPVSVKLKMKNVQETPDDPLVFEMDAMPMVREVLKEHSGRFYEYRNGDIEIFPKKFFPILSKFVVFSVKFTEVSVNLRLKPHEESE